MKNLPVLTAAAAALFSACALDLAVPVQPLRGGIKGLVDTDKHLPLLGNKVQLVCDKGSKGEATTDAMGAFVFADLPVGPCSVDVALDGFQRLSQRVVVVAGQQADLGTLKPVWLTGTPAEGSIFGLVAVGGCESTSMPSVDSSS